MSKIQWFFRRTLGQPVQSRLECSATIQNLFWHWLIIGSATMKLIRNDVCSSAFGPKKIQHGKGGFRLSEYLMHLGGFSWEEWAKLGIKRKHAWHVCYVRMNQPNFIIKSSMLHFITFNMKHWAHVQNLLLALFQLNTFWDRITLRHRQMDMNFTLTFYMIHFNVLFLLLLRQFVFRIHVYYLSFVWKFVWLNWMPDSHWIERGVLYLSTD